jgi:His-Xaa-Ser system protein HxsD
LVEDILARFADVPAAYEAEGWRATNMSWIVGGRSFGLIESSFVLAPTPRGPGRCGSVSGVPRATLLGLKNERDRGRKKRGLAPGARVREIMSESQIETLDAAGSTLVLSLDTGLYPRDVLYAAAYVFLDRAYVLLDRQASRYIVRMRAKQALDEATLRAMAGEFENELLAQALRQRVVKANQRIIESITSLAIGGATIGSRPANDVADDLIDMENPGEDGFLDDPQGIATPWEAKKGAREQ